MLAPDDSQIAAALRHLEMSDEELYEELSRNDADYAFTEDAIDWGKKLFRNLKANLQGSVCNDENVRDIFARGAANRRLMLVCAIVDLVETGGAMSVAALIVKEGLQTYCVKIWDLEQ